MSYPGDRDGSPPRRDDSDRRQRRASPAYEAYAQRKVDDAARTNPDTPLEPVTNGQAPPWRRGPPATNGGSGDWISQRREQRAASTATVWATSPLRAEHDASPPPRSKRSSRRRRDSISSSSSSSDDSEADQKKRKHKHHRSSKHRSSKHSSSRRSKRSASPRPRPGDDDAVWVEAAPSRNEDRALVPRTSHAQDDSSDDEIGPMPAPAAIEKPRDPREYGGALLRGEGAAMAAFAADGSRIPRRGEIGLESTDIEKYEKAGYVMSGNRNKRMTEVRIRKENQVISAEEKRGLLQLQAEEKVKREAAIISSFKEMVDASLKPQKK